MGIGTGMNISLWGDQQKDLAVALYRALDWNNRMDAKGRGIIQLSIQALETGWSPKHIVERLFKAGKFASTEEMTRLQTEYDGVGVVQRKREKEYPSIQDQLDMQYWDKVNSTTTWADAIAKVKTENPK